MTSRTRVGILGAGAWGTALAQAAARAGCEIVLVARDPAVVQAIETRHENSRRLPGIALDAGVRATTDPNALASAAIVLLALPAQALRAALPGLPSGDAALVVTAKGFERASGRRLSEVVAEERPGAHVAVLSGPSFATEVARGLPTAVTIACRDAATGRVVAHALGGPSFRCYWSDDVVGVEVGGAVKNVLAIAAGIVMGRGLGENARAALITRGLAELARFGEAMGGQSATFTGLSGLGDVVLTCSSLASRNTAFGHRLARGGLVDGEVPLAEGRFTAAAVVRRAAELGVEMPICRAVDDVLAGRVSIDAAIEGLLARRLRPEAPD